ncbi:MAG: MarR family transcriptional regulator [Candidatus Andeanibacterium colombiense]|uniref:MarR family transcriptional regulator n=1 Tax=Candidatus Andeanibacterium colombiense TaxID=3121345 RepID=A0AAJ6BPJ7_9SPHN|nr:MAG: MarR family transcriptional regulator [Sphingomonadaceae bacterium]
MNDPASLTRKLMLLGNQMMELASELGRTEDGVLGTEDRFDALRDDSPAWRIAAQRLYDERKRRADFFPAMMFGEAAWDMLLDLYVAEKRNELISITSACVASNAPATTALRWIRMLEEQELATRFADERDGRRNFIRISERGYALMTAYLAAIQPQWRDDDVLRPRIRRPDGTTRDRFDPIERRKGNGGI